MNDRPTQNDGQLPAARPDAATYISLFADEQTRSAPGALMANNSRLAYLVHLKEMIQAFEVRADVSAPITLLKRRPDLLALKLDEKNARKVLPKVNMVLSLLESRAKQVQPPKQTLQEAVAAGSYLANVPFHHAWEATKAALALKQLYLGDVLRSTAPGYPAFIFDNLTLATQRAAMTLSSGFSPQLQALLLEKRGNDADFYQTHFSCEDSNPLERLSNTRTLGKALGLTRRELRKLLAVNAVGEGNTSVARSAHVTARSVADASSQAHGAAFINSAGPALYLTASPATPPSTNKNVRISGLSIDHLDRLQRILRVQRALELSAAETDSLVMAALRAEGQTGDYHLTGKTLRALGLYRHLQQKYGVNPWQFAALLDVISPYATDLQASLYDKLFAPTNRDAEGQAAQVLTLDDGEFDHKATSGKDALTLKQLALGLKVDETTLRSVLAWVIEAQKLTTPKRSLPVISACYRIITLSRLFATSTHQGLALLALLMAQQPAYREQLAGVPSLAVNTGQADIVDVITGALDAMQLLPQQGQSAKENPFELSADAVTHITAHPASFGLNAKGKNSLQQPDLSTAYQLKRYKALLARLAAGQSEQHVLKYLADFDGKADDSAKAWSRLETLLGRPRDSLVSLLGIAPPTTLSDLDRLLRLLDIADQHNLSVGTLIDLQTLPQAKGYAAFQQAASGVRRSCSAKQRKALDNQLSVAWRDALMQWMLVHWAPKEQVGHWVTSPQSLADYLLIDLQVSHEPLTTRVLSATASLQRYLHQVHSRLENGYRDCQISEAERNEWEQFSSSYERWKLRKDAQNEPQNYIDPTRRQRKTTAFQDLESQLAQGKCRPEDIQTALLGYLSTFEKLSNIQPISAYADGTDPLNDTYHFIGKTNVEPAEYYWRTLDMSQRAPDNTPSMLAWGEWEKITLSISGQLVMTPLPKPAEYVKGKATAAEEKRKEQAFYAARSEEDKLLASDLRTHIELVRPVIIAGRRYVVWVERETTAICMGANSKPSIYYPLRVNFALQQTDGTWSPPNELFTLDGRDADGQFDPEQSPPKATNGTATNKTFLKAKDYSPGLMAMVNINGDRLHDPWLTIVLFDTNSPTSESFEPKRNIDYFIVTKDLLLIENRELDVVNKGARPLERKLVANWLKFFRDPRTVQHPYSGALIELTHKKDGSTPYAWSAAADEKISTEYDIAHKGQVALSAELSDNLEHINISVSTDEVWMSRSEGWLVKSTTAESDDGEISAQAEVSATNFSSWQELIYVRMAEELGLRLIYNGDHYLYANTFEESDYVDSYTKWTNELAQAAGLNAKEDEEYEYIEIEDIRLKYTRAVKAAAMSSYYKLGMVCSITNKTNKKIYAKSYLRASFKKQTNSFATKIIATRLAAMDEVNKLSYIPKALNLTSIQLFLEFMAKATNPSLILNFDPLDIAHHETAKPAPLTTKLSVALPTQNNATWTLSPHETERLSERTLNELKTLALQSSEAFNQLKASLLKVRYLQREAYNVAMGLTAEPDNAKPITVTAAIDNARLATNADAITAFIATEKTTLRNEGITVSDDLLEETLRLRHLDPPICQRILLYIDPAHTLVFEDALVADGTGQVTFQCPVNRDISDYTFTLSLYHDLPSGPELLGSATQAYTLVDRNDDAVPSVQIRRNDEQALYLSFKEANQKASAANGSHDEDKRATKPSMLPIDSLRLNTLFGKRLVALATQSVERVLSWEAQSLPEPRLEPGSSASTVDFRGANGLYFWELFFHVPFLVAWLSRQNREYREAWRWCTRQLFDPYRTWAPEGKHPPLFWLTLPLLSRAAFTATQQTNDPDLLAYAEPERYRKALHLFVVQSWQRQGDDQYRLLTLDSLVEAALCYDKALRLIGVLPESLSTAPVQAPSLAEASTASFTPPLNNKLVELRNLLRNRQFNLRHGLSLDGNPASIMLNPEALDQIVLGHGGAGQDQASEVTIARVVPPCRYEEVRKAADDAVLQLIELGQSQMRFYDKDATLKQALANKVNLVKLLDFPCRLKEQAVELARRERDTVLASKQLARRKQTYYQGLVDEGITDLEHASRAFAYMSQMALGVSTVFSASSKIIDATVPTIYGLAFGGNRPAQGVAQGAVSFEMMSKICDMTADELRLQAEYQLRSQQWQFEADQASLELQILDKQLLERDIHIKAAIIALEEARATQAAHLAEYELMTSVFASHPTYLWMIGRMAEIYSSAYDATLSLCLMAEACLQYELGDFESTWIKTDGWLDNWRGMLAGEALERDLMQMAVAALRENKRPLDIRKDLKLSKLNGWNTQDLHKALEADEVLFELAPWHFDDDFPGHYLRRIERITLSFNIAKVSASTPISAMLYQTSNKVLLSDDLDGAKHLYSAKQGSPRHVLRDLRPNQSVAIWSAKEVSRNFDLQPSIPDKTRYQPFEGTGVMSSWRLEFPGGAINNPALYKDGKWVLDDITVQISFSAVEGSASLREGTKALLAAWNASKTTDAEHADDPTAAPANTDNAVVAAKEAEQTALAALKDAQTAAEDPLLQASEAAAELQNANSAVLEAQKALKDATAARAATVSAAKAGAVDSANSEAQKAQQAAQAARAAATAAGDALEAARGASEKKRKLEAAIAKAKVAEEAAADALKAAKADADAPELKAPDAAEEARQANAAVSQAGTAAAQAKTARENAEAAALAGDADKALGEAEKASQAADMATMAAQTTIEAKRGAEAKARERGTFFELLANIRKCRTYAQVKSLLDSIAGRKAVATDQQVLEALRNAQVYALIWGVYVADTKETKEAVVAVTIDAKGAALATAVSDALAAQKAYEQALGESPELPSVAEAISAYDNATVQRARLVATLKSYLGKRLSITIASSLQGDRSYTGIVKCVDEAQAYVEHTDETDDFLFKTNFTKLRSISAPLVALSALSTDWQDINL